MFRIFPLQLSVGTKVHYVLKQFEPISLMQFRRNLLNYPEQAKSMNAATIISAENENGFKKILAEHSSKFYKDADDMTLYKNSHEIVKQFLCDKKTTLDLEAVANRNKELLDHNNIGNRIRRFKICVETYRILAPNDMLSNEHILRVSVMAYLAEMLTHVFAIIDDVLDHSDLRRNKLPWYKIAGIETINDSILIYSGMLLTLKHFFEKESYYVPCFQLINEVAWTIAVALSYDVRTFNSNDSARENLTMEMYRKLCSSKGTWNCFYMPVIIAMQMANFDYSGISEKLLKILDDLGYHLIMHNDYSDRYGKTTGKVLDEDIKEGKLSWMVLKATELANNDQKEIITQCYGKKDAECFEAIINVYNQLKLDQVAIAYEKELFDSITKEIKALPDPKVQKVMIYAQNMLTYWYKDL